MSSLNVELSIILTIRAYVLIVNYLYLKEPNIPRSGNQENSIKLVRSWEDPRYGFRTTKGLQDHLKLYELI